MLEAELSPGICKSTRGAPLEFRCEAGSAVRRVLQHQLVGARARGVLRARGSGDSRRGHARRTLACRFAGGLLACCCVWRIERSRCDTYFNGRQGCRAANLLRPAIWRIPASMRKLSHVP